VKNNALAVLNNWWFTKSQPFAWRPVCAGTETPVAEDAYPMQLFFAAPSSSAAHAASIARI
jgi:hypothetical protein